MAWAAADTLHLDLSASWVIGDRPEDMGLAEAIGASAVYVGSQPLPGRTVVSFESLAEAAPFVVDRIGR